MSNTTHILTGWEAVKAAVAFTAAYVGVVGAAALLVHWTLKADDR